MEYLSGESLKRKLASRAEGTAGKEAIDIVKSMPAASPCPSQRHRPWGSEAGQCVGYRRGDVKIIDSAIARLIDAASAGRRCQGDERPRLSALTPPYASPEMLENAPPDARDDIYALACIAHELLTGRHPFDRMVRTMRATVA